MKQLSRVMTVLVLGMLGAAPAVGAKCSPDSVQVGSVCMDKYEASVWRVPNPTTVNKGLVKKIQQGKAKLADLTAGGATQLGVTGYDYAPCTSNGQTCKDDIYAVSIAGMTPSAYSSWFQANVACANAGKRLPRNAEWQMAVTGTPDPSIQDFTPDNGTTDCNTVSTQVVANSGSRSSCVSAFAAYDMVGNLDEWVADWVPRSTTCPDWSGFSDDSMCLAGADATLGPGALLRGGNFFFSSFAGPLAVRGDIPPYQTSRFTGFRCARTVPVKGAPDSVQAGSAHMDKYEASVWRVPNPTTTNKGLVKKIQQGKAKATDLTKGGATQLGLTGDDYAPCTANGQTCKDDIYAVSVAGVTPSGNMTWFQANVACANAGKRLPSNAEWQRAVTGTQDPGPDNHTTDCNTFFSPVANTGSRSGCVSAFGAFDMVGNLYEWVADWMPLSPANLCPGWAGFSFDYMCLAGTDTTRGPGALVRGGDSFYDFSGGGPLNVHGDFWPTIAAFGLGFRCAR